MDNKHININHPTPEFEDLFSKAEIPYNKSKENIWKNLENKIQNTQISKTKYFRFNYLIIRAAAIIISIVGLSIIFSFYSKTFECPRGQHLSVILPDNSKVELNAQSTIKFFPLRWYLKREVLLEGEGFFEVKKAKKFEVRSANGRTVVLGTSFNIFSREEKYKVNCISGSVKVISNTDNEAVLKPDQFAEIDINGNIDVETIRKSEKSTSWINNMFIFTSVPLIEVIKEIERQYDVTFSIKNNIDDYYTGFFSKEKPLYEVLDLLSKPFDLIFVKNKNGEYTIQYDRE